MMLQHGQELLSGSPPCGHLTSNPRIFNSFRFLDQTGPRYPSGSVRVAEISLGARSKMNLVEFLTERQLFVQIQISKRYLSAFGAFRNGSTRFVVTVCLPSHTATFLPLGIFSTSGPTQTKKKEHYFFGFFLICLAASAAKYCEKGAVNQSAASAASPDYVKFLAVIKSAASAASQIQGTQVQGSAQTAGDGGTTGTAGRRIGSGDGGGALP